MEDFVDWTGIIVSELAKKKEMSRLAARFATGFGTGFATRKSKLAAGSEGETTPISNVKPSKRSSLDEEAQKD